MVNNHKVKYANDIQGSCTILTGSSLDNDDNNYLKIIMMIIIIMIINNNNDNK